MTISKGTYRGIPLEDYSKDELIDIIVRETMSSMAQISSLNSDLRTLLAVS
jgi:hypothetical protein